MWTEEKPEASAACTKLRLSSACYARLSSSRWSCDGRLRELADREDDTENKGPVNCNLENATTFFFRPDQQTVSGFELVVHSAGCVHTTALCTPHATKCGLNVTRCLQND